MIHLHGTPAPQNTRTGPEQTKQYAYVSVVLFEKFTWHLLTHIRGVSSRGQQERDEHRGEIISALRAIRLSSPCGIFLIAVVV